ncbi:uncharacterized protein LOC111263476 isoform X2 [Varroa jacobsoni]|uniref:Ig-like domain-containing protein n=2 Tax=Varroa destructor TaxID=109461 RepID=A0A7M7KRE4_VARDE|nr:uncharacterized protein LOC111253830 isoform X1 [Varroa destructor]XP_022669635.1 uncharacterized protein LOC111253830 isoform X1 [Varroa destructor]XP_022669636.1 uncharacterized protein LOC111253830 isoform X1 [Varroa destructor]XP_022694311.1 uncharacterized protein LOC111263476 isoform X2 [Varroa jacobsoni]
MRPLRGIHTAVTLVLCVIAVDGYQHRQRGGGIHHRGRGNKVGGGFMKESPANSPKMNTVPLANPPPPLVSKISPHFDNTTPPQVTAAQGKAVFLPCNVRHLGDRTVSWIRRTVEGGLNVLTVGRFAYTMDQRFQVIHFDNSESWALHIKYASLDDSGVYECQVSTTPKISRFVRLDVVESRASIIGGPSLYVNGGSVLRLVCFVDGIAAAPTSTSTSSSSSPSTSSPTSSPTSGNTEFVFWFRNGKLLNYDQDLRHRVSLSIPPPNTGLAESLRPASPIRHAYERILANGQNYNSKKNHLNNNSNENNAGNRPVEKEQPQRRLESRLEISSVRVADSGNYSCQPSNSAPDVIQVFVIANEPPAAMQDSVVAGTLGVRSPAAVVRSRELLLSMLLLPLYLLR